MGASVTSVNTFQLLTSNHIHNNGFHFANNGCWIFERNQLWFPYLDYQTWKTFRSQSFLLWSVKISSEVEGTRTGQKVPFMERWLLKAQYKTIKNTDLETGQRGETLEDKQKTKGYLLRGLMKQDTGGENHPLMSTQKGKNRKWIKQGQLTDTNRWILDTRKKVTLKKTKS